MTPQISGLLPGCELVRFGTCGAEEFEQMDDRIYRGARGNSQIIVKPATGYEFRFDITINAYRAVKVFAVKRTFTALIVCETDADLGYCETISKMPVTLSITETTPVPTPPEVKP